MPLPFHPQLYTQAVGEKVEYLVWIDSGHMQRLISISGGFDQRDQIHPEAILTNYPNYAQPRASQRIGVTGAGWLFVNRKETNKLIELIGECYSNRHGRCGNRICRALRGVMIANSICDRLRFTVMQRVISAHYALQFGELPNHPSNKVGFGEFGGSFCEYRVGSHSRGDYSDQAAQAPHTSSLGAELGVKDHLIKRCNVGDERRAPVMIPEMPCVSEAGAQHALIACGKRSTVVICFDVGDEPKPRGRRAIAGSEREVALIDAHRNPKDFRW